MGASCCVFLCVLQENFVGGKEGLWRLPGSETNRLRSHVLGISGILSLDKLGNKLN